MKNKKGFTLIELLTVIAILAVILLIAAPTILGVLEKAKKNTFKNQVLLYAEGLKQQVALSQMGKYGDINISLPDKGNETKVSVSELNKVMNSEQLNGGYFIICSDANGNITYKIQGVKDDTYIINGKKEITRLEISDIVPVSEASSPSLTFDVNES